MVRTEIYLLKAPWREGGTCEEMCFEKRRVEMAVAQGVRVLGC